MNYLHFIVNMHRKINKEKDWFRIKNYPHIGMPLKFSDRSWVTSYVKDKDKIAQHSFLPFIHRKIIKRKFRKDYSEDSIAAKLRKRWSNKKQREIFFASHLDSNVYSYYADIIQNEYEKKLIDFSIDSCVTAYRKIPHESEIRNKCNIDFANDVFDNIRNSEEDELAVVTFDIVSFFDNLNHEILKNMWNIVMGFDGLLPKDHFNVFKNITNFSFVEERNIFKYFQDKIIVKRLVNGKIVYKRRLIKKRRYMRDREAVAYCKTGDVKALRQAKLINSNKLEKDGERRKKGIPQGSPISAVLANVYLLFFDKSVNDFMSRINGIYKRYSDDIVIICSLDKKEEVIEYIEKEIQKYKLEINSGKTQIFQFLKLKDEEQYDCFMEDLKTGELTKNRNFQYLGFEFDGKYTLLRSASLSKFYRTMKRCIRRGDFYSRSIQNDTSGLLLKKRLYKKFTHLVLIGG